MLPERLHGDYQSRREASPLGRVFKIANGLHDEIDAMVVVGSAAALRGIRAVVAACCDPLHNELTRAQRGSRPRVYFAGDTCDNDSVAALLQRLRTPSQRSEPDRWAVIALSDDDEDGVVREVIGHLLAAMNDHLASDAAQGMARLFIAMAHQDSWLHRLADSLGCDEVFVQEADVADPLDVLSLANHLPAALLGLDCMRWLGGAFEMKEHFLNAPFEVNLVMQFITWEHLLSQALAIDSTSVHLFADALTPLGRWFVESRHVIGQGKAIPIRIGDWTSNASQSQPATGTSLNLNLKVDLPRTDPLRRPKDERFGALVDCGLGDRENRLRSAPVRSDDLVGPTLDLVAPELDTFTLGQLFQWMLLVASVDRQLRKV